MRKKEREMTHKEDFIRVLDRCDSCRVAFCSDNIPYIVPMNYGYTYEGDELILYFHSGLSGKKLEMLRANNQVSFQMDCSHQLIPDEIPCRYTMKFESLMGQGKMSILTEEAEKIEALEHVMKKYAPDKSFHFESKHARVILGLKLVVEELTGRRSVKGGRIS